MKGAYSQWWAKINSDYAKSESLLQRLASTGMLVWLQLFHQGSRRGMHQYGDGIELLQWLCALVMMHFEEQYSFSYELFLEVYRCGKTMQSYM